MNIVTLLGLLAGALTTIAAFPQAIKSWKTKQTHDLSIGMYITLTTGVVLWIIYGVFIRDVPIIAANALTLVLVGMILSMKIKYG